MTYCVALNLKDGLILASDTRTNAGVDQISIYRKIFKYQIKGERVIFIQCSGNLATTQAVIEHVNSQIKKDSANNILKVSSLFEVANIISEILVEIISRISSYSINQNINFKSNFIISGQIKNQNMMMYYIYPEGNFIHSTNETPYFQIGETKYGKPILDRTICYNSELKKALVSVLVSFDSAIKSNISVGCPINVIVYNKNHLICPKGITIPNNDVYFTKIREEWHRGLIDLINDLDMPPDIYFK